VTRWQFWDLAHWHPACAVFAVEYLIKPRLLGINEPDMTAVAKGTEEFERAAKVLDGQLAGKRFVTGDRLTLADFSLGAGHEPGHNGALSGRAYSEIKRWYASLCALPAWQKTLALCAMPAPAASAA